MKTIILALIVVNLTACAAPVNFLASIYDGADTCQRTDLLDKGKYPSYCGAGSGKTYITRDYLTNKPIATTRAQ